TIIPSIAIESVGIETGATGIEYGQSTGGVIQTQLKTGSALDPYGTLYAEYNTVGEVIGMAEYSGGSGAWDYYVAGQAVHGDYGDNYETHTRQLQDLTLYSGLTKIGFRPNELGRIEVLFIGGEEDHHYLQDTDDGDVRYKTKKDNLFIATRYDHVTVNDTKWDIGATYNDFHENRINLETNQSERDRPQEQYNLFTNLSKDLELSDAWNWYTVNGVQYSDETFSDVTNDEKRFDFSDASIYTNNSFIWEETVELNAGLRGSRIDNGYRDLNKVTYDLGVAVQVPVVGQLHVSNYTGYNLNKAYYLFWGGGEFIDRDPQDGLKPTETYTWEIGWEKEFLLLENPGSARITYFHTKETNLFNFGDTGSGVPFYDEGVAEGIEAWFDWYPIETLNLFAGYAHIDNRRTGSSNPNASNLDLQFTPLPEHSASIGASWMFLENWFFTASGIYNSGYQREFYDQDAREIETFNDFFQVDVAVSWNINERFTVFGRIENLLNEKDLGYSSVREESDGTITDIDSEQEDPGILFALGGEIHF
ncbi:MAG: TonB-dependent receptor, partial [Puniceicoccales bacterium]